MKKNLLLLGAIALVGSASLFLTGCGKDDTTAPAVALTGAADMTIFLNSAFSDPGATATDDEDGTVAVSVSGTVNNNLKGDYTLTYTAVDAAGNQGSATRTVHVVNEAESYAGIYSVRDSIVNDANYTFKDTITTSSTVNNRIHFKRFANYSNNSGIYATITGGGNTIDVPSQSAIGIGGLSENHTFGGTGTRTGDNFRLIYTDKNDSGGGATATCVDDYTKL